mmetsp:Transcript_40828/g.65594  ORF Transcript_40828/g.65594 Transcript_40828/m.65594 type:complete len:391 (+) Transcript_40828:495-1667(+)
MFVLDLEARFNQSDIQQQIGHILQLLIILALTIFDAVLQIDDHWMSVVDLQDLGRFDTSTSSKRLRLGQLLHIGTIAILGSTNRHRRLSQSRADHHFAHSRAVHILEPRLQVLELVFFLLEEVLHFLAIDLGSILVDGLELEIIVILQVQVLIEVVDKVQNLPVSRSQSLHKRRSLHLVNRRTADIINVFLSRLHASDIGSQRDGHIARLRGRESQQIQQALLVPLVLQQSQLDRFTKLFPEFAVIAIRRWHVLLLFIVASSISSRFFILVLLIRLIRHCHLLEHIEYFARQLPRDQLHHLGLLQIFTVHIQRQIVAVDQAFDKVEVSWHDVLELIGHQHPPHIQLHGRFAVIILVIHSRRSTRWNVQNRVELDLALCFEVSVIERIRRI